MRMPEDEAELMGKLTFRSLGVRKAYQVAGHLAVEAWEYVAFCTTSDNPVMRDLVPHYEAIARAWEAQGLRILQAFDDDAPAPPA